MVEVERGVGAVEGGPCAELRGGEARNDDPGELRVFAGEGGEEGSPAAGRLHGGAVRLKRLDVLLVSVGPAQWGTISASHAWWWGL